MLFYSTSLTVICILCTVKHYILLKHLMYTCKNLHTNSKIIIGMCREWLRIVNFIIIIVVFQIA